ncbi:MAG: helix-turn-helix transcriptional regulator [Gammaproteobacteria bacterium]|nr:helix-turn-helix transcriptional regulator [Gammaproteobacteria bacterium]
MAEVVFKPSSKVTAARLKTVIRNALDRYVEEERVPASLLHAEAKRRHGSSYQTPGYYLKLYRHRGGFTQARLARKGGMLQHHISEMEHNRRPIGKTLARKVARILNCDYRRLL